MLDRYDDNPYRVSPIQLRQTWSGIIQRGQSRTFTTVLGPHVPAFDVNRGELEAFATAAQGGAPFPISHDQMVHGVAVTDAIVASARSGRMEAVA